MLKLHKSLQEGIHVLVGVWLAVGARGVAGTAPDRVGQLQG